MEGEELGGGAAMRGAAMREALYAHPETLRCCTTRTATSSKKRKKGEDWLVVLFLPPVRVPRKGSS